MGENELAFCPLCDEESSIQEQGWENRGKQHLLAIIYLMEEVQNADYKNNHHQSIHFDVLYPQILRTFIQKHCTCMEKYSERGDS